MILVAKTKACAQNAHRSLSVSLFFSLFVFLSLSFCFFLSVNNFRLVRLLFQSELCVSQIRCGLDEAMFIPLIQIRRNYNTQIDSNFQFTPSQLPRWLSGKFSILFLRLLNGTKSITIRFKKKTTTMKKNYSKSFEYLFVHWKLSIHFWIPIFNWIKVRNLWSEILNKSEKICFSSWESHGSHDK